MRELHSFKDERTANLLSAVLIARAMPAMVDEESDQWVVWIQNDDHREPARDVLTTFLANPDAPEFATAQTDAKKREAERVKASKARQKLHVNIQDRWAGVWYRCYPATMVLIGISMFVMASCTNWQTAQGDGLFGLHLCNDDESTFRNALYIQGPTVVDFFGFQVGPYFRETDLLSTLKRGEVWRPVTPIFLHFSLMHIFFNMSWLQSLGRWIEYYRGTRRFVPLVLILAITSNVAQLYWSGPNFGGMSGVVYGLIGYSWMRGKTLPHQNIGLSQNQVVFAVLWMLLCAAGAFGAIANTAHAVGFVVGLLIGGRQAMWKRVKSQWHRSDQGGPT